MLARYLSFFSGSFAGFYKTQAPLKLSKNKQEYLEKKVFRPYQLTASDLSALIKHYEDKHKIRIFLNGETEIAKSVIEKKKELIEESLNNSDFDDARKQLAKERLIVKDVNIASVQALVTRLEDHADCSIDKADCLTEILYIQNKLNDDETVGYIYTNGHTTRTFHFEVLIISKDKIIKPVCWWSTDPALWVSSPEILYSPNTQHIAECVPAACRQYGMRHTWIVIFKRIT